jgi:hypothetical protein
MICISIHVRLHLLLFFPCFHFPCCLPSSLDLFFSTIWFIIKSCSNFSLFFYSLFIVRYCNRINCKIIQNILLFLKFNDYKNYKLIILKGINKIINNSNERLSFKLLQSIMRKYNSIDQTLILLFKDHQFEFHKSQGHWRFTWSLTLGPVRLVGIRVRWPEHPH